jgi:hypothetical protein
MEMLSRLSACFLAFGLLGSAAGSANAPVDHPSAAPVVEAAIPMRVPPERTDVYKALQKRRAKNLAAFRAYRKGGVYPHNTWRTGPLNVWRDASGHLCAAATMISKDGKSELVAQTADSDNFIRLQNVTEGALLDWILTSGFTIEEIDRIQLPAVRPDEIVSPETLKQEDARLAASYKATDAWLVARTKAGVETAVNRLMKNPWLAHALVDGTL